MKTEMSSIDILAVVGELQSLKGARINKAFQTTPQELKLQLNVREEGRAELVIEAGKRLHLTEHPRPSPEVPTAFAMTLRKYLGNGVVEGIAQVAFDRVVEIKCGRDGEFSIIAELFGKGNVVLTDGEGNILTVMRPESYRDRELAIRARYKYPPRRTDPFQLSLEEFRSVIEGSKGDLVRTLATVLGMGGPYAEELCLRAGIQKDRKGLSEAEIEAVYRALQDLRSSIGRERPVIVMEDHKPVDVAAVRLKIHEGRELVEFESFNKALDEYFTNRVLGDAEADAKTRFEGRLKKLRDRLEGQRATIEKYRELEKTCKEVGDLVYANFQLVDGILAAINAARKTHPWEEIIGRLEEGKEEVPWARAVRTILPREGVLVLELDGREVRLELNKGIAENAQRYYEEGKKAREKVAGAVEAAMATDLAIENLVEKGVAPPAGPKPRRRVVGKREWYEKFRWFISSEGFLVLGGRDATSNEVLVKRHMDSRDLFIHAEIHGAPAVVIKTQGKEVPEATLQEAFDFAASYSKAWKHSLYGLDVYWVRPEQVSKTPEPGEYLTKGAFVVRGKKNFGKGRVGIAIGVAGEKVVGGPPSAVEKVARIAVKLLPGRKKAQEVAEEVRARLSLAAGTGEEKGEISQILPEEIIKFLPQGGAELAERAR